MISIVEDVDDKKYNSVASHPLQSWEWGEARKKMGINVLRLSEYQDKTLKNVFQLTFHPIPYTAYSVGYLPRSTWPTKEVMDFIFDYAKKHNSIFVKIEPNIKKSPISNTKYLINNTYQITQSSHPLFPEWTQTLDLTKREEDLLKKMHHKTRYNISLAQKKGVTVKEMSNENGFEIFSKLYFETCKRQRYFGHTPRYHRFIWESLNKSIAHILIAYYQNTPLAAYELFYFDKKFYYPYGGTSIEFRNVMAANLLMWEAVRLGKQLGAQTFDMWGSLPPQYDQSHDWAGFTRFKEGYGTQFVQFTGSFDLVINPLGYKIYNTIYQLRNSYLQLKKII